MTTFIKFVCFIVMAFLIGLCLQPGDREVTFGQSQSVTIADIDRQMAAKYGSEE